MPRLEGLIFDLDGTLVDSAPDLRLALNRTLAEHGRRDVSLDEAKRMAGDGLLVMLQRAFAATGEELTLDQSYQMSRSFITYYREQKADPSQIYPYVLDLLSFYKNKGVPMGICTNKQEASTLKLLDELDMTRFFTFIAGGDTFMVHKPNPGHVLGVIERMNVAKEGCVMVGDSTNDVRAAQAAGIPCVVVTHGYGLDVDNLGADDLIDSLDKLANALNKLSYAV